MRRTRERKNEILFSERHAAKAVVTADIDDSNQTSGCEKVEGDENICSDGSSGNSTPRKDENTCKDQAACSVRYSSPVSIPFPLSETNTTKLRFGDDPPQDDDFVLRIFESESGKKVRRVIGRVTDVIETKVKIESMRRRLGRKQYYFFFPGIRDAIVVERQHIVLKLDPVSKRRGRFVFGGFGSLKALHFDMESSDLMGLTAKPLPWRYLESRCSEDLGRIKLFPVLLSL